MHTKILTSLPVVLAIITAIFLSSCSYNVIPTRNGGAKLKTLTAPPVHGTTIEWTGEKNQDGYATGKGNEIWYGPDGKKTYEWEGEYLNGLRHGGFVGRLYSFGKMTEETRCTYSNGLQVGECEAINFAANVGSDWVRIKTNYSAQGQISSNETKHLNGERTVTGYTPSGYSSSTTYNRDGTVKQVPRTTSSSSSDDSDFLGAMMAIGGAAVGSADLTMAGISTVAGDEAGAMQHINNLASGSSETTGTARTAFAAGGTTAAPKRKIQRRDNLINEYGLKKYRGLQSDHISQYISAADKALDSYHQTGEENYYTQHKEYADIALQFHKQTKTEGTRLLR